VHSIIVVVAGLAVTILALLAIWLVTMRLSGSGPLDNITVSRDWLVHHRDNDRS